MGITVTLAPAAEPLSLAEAKAHLRVDHDADNTYITTLIEVAREECEVFTGRSCITRTLALKLDRFPPYNRTPIYLTRGPVQSVTSITYTDSAGSGQTWSSGNYQTDFTEPLARILPAYGESYPDTRDIMNAVVVTYKAGYGDASTSVPETLRQGLLLRIGDLYENRESFVTGTIVSPIPRAVERLWDVERIIIFE